MQSQRPRTPQLSLLVAIAVALALTAPRSLVADRPVAPADPRDGRAALEQALSRGFIRSLDTMKESHDLQRGAQLSDAEIAHTVALSRALDASHIAVATHWEHADYLARWVRAARSAGLGVWFRGQPARWTEPDGRPMTPAEYLDALDRFVRGNAALFADGDIFDPGPEPENGAYWSATWGPRWGWDPAYPNEATRAFNSFIRESQVRARELLAAIGRHSVITSVRSLNGWWAAHPGALEHETVATLGVLTIDSYPDAYATDPAEAAALRAAELREVWRLWGRAVILGEIGYPLVAHVADEVQRAALARTLSEIRRLPFVVGMNYWVGAPNPDPGGHRTAIFAGQRGAWRPLPAAWELAAFYADPPPARPPAAPPWRYGPDLLAVAAGDAADPWTIEPPFAHIPAEGDGGPGLRVAGDGMWANAHRAVRLPSAGCYVLAARARGGAARLDILRPSWEPIAFAVARGDAGWVRVTLPFAATGPGEVIVAVRDGSAAGPLELIGFELRACPGAAVP